MYQYKSLCGSFASLFYVISLLENHCRKLPGQLLEWILGKGQKLVRQVLFFWDTG